MHRAHQAVILSAVRTPIGRFLGSLAAVSAVELGAAAARAAIGRSGIEAEEIGEAVVGNVLQAGLGQAPARQVALKAGMPATASALTVNMVCGSGLRSVMLASQSIRLNEASFVLAGGMESMSRAPHLLRDGRSGWKYGDAPLIDHLAYDGLRCSTEEWPMGKAADWTASHANLSRERLDAFSVESHRRAIAAREAGAFTPEIEPFEIPSRKGPTRVEHDEGPRPDSTLQSLAKLSPAFDPAGCTTAGNSSMMSDGAAMLVIGDEAEAMRRGLKPKARIIASAISGRPPKELFLAPADAIRRLLEVSGRGVGDIDLFELNEAFAAQALANIDDLGLDESRVNVHGGAIAIGHPIGASGARILVTLVHALERTNGRFGIASACLGGGNAVAMLIERIGDDR
jgi:acetyl-CoA C-acetyltransferase